MKQDDCRRHLPSAEHRGNIRRFSGSLHRTPDMSRNHAACRWGNIQLLLVRENGLAKLLRRTPLSAKWQFVRSA